MPKRELVLGSGAPGLDVAPGLSLHPGGEPPTEAQLVIARAVFACREEYRRGDEVMVLVHGRVEEVRFGPQTRTHVVRVVDLIVRDDTPVGEVGLFGPVDEAPEDDEEPSDDGG